MCVYRWRTTINLAGKDSHLGILRSSCHCKSQVLSKRVSEGTNLLIVLGPVYSDTECTSEEFPRPLDADTKKRYMMKLPDLFRRIVINRAENTTNKTSNGFGSDCLKESRFDTYDASSPSSSSAASSASSASQLCVCAVWHGMQKIFFPRSSIAVHQLSKEHRLDYRDVVNSVRSSAEQDALSVGKAEMLCMSFKRTCGDRSQNEACRFSFATALSLVRQEDVEKMTDGTPLVRFMDPAGGYWNSRLYFLVEFEHQTYSHVSGSSPMSQLAAMSRSSIS
ncbi:hypothetical protein BO83DRAFT_389729 [Aspergillus eucalypticola CBS 122712]|uniref:Uncharacterized protein n=1 Tax=Aspergillus eucalypticola (strain CBS 122712 / IBT 29274) TaxID=1448314 RepID=A0A317VAQ6_ASPEC|nr:uncharacterized protein BO83DRAFT_389729 [Aspergillus eucalypticola CBS 122712]PWY71433.1 hypothetical protein BO83DRAFT_389729 [Aspergillus eucalypticola CBS 122712]